MMLRMSGVFLRMVMPWFCTEGGSSGKANWTRFWTMTSAVFRSVPMSKVTVSVYEPSLPICEDMYSMPSTPLTCCSIGAATVSATTWALAPGYWIVTATAGGVIGGYCAMGRANSAIRPGRVMNMDSTAAKIGRSMKKREIMQVQKIRTGGNKENGEEGQVLIFLRFLCLLLFDCSSLFL